MFLLWLYLHRFMIYFNNIPKNLLSALSLSQWLCVVAVFYKVKIKTLQYNFVSESELLKMNQDYLQHDTHTDIITFSYASTPIVEAEIYISIDRMRENAIINNETIENELLRLLSHGFLHSMGYNDASKEEKTVMSREENKCIKMFHVKQEKDV